MNQEEFALKVTEITQKAEKEVKNLIESIAPETKKMATLSAARALMIEGMSANLKKTTSAVKLSGSKAIYTVNLRLDK